MKSYTLGALVAVILSGCRTIQIAKYVPVHIQGLDVSAVTFETRKVWFYHREFWRSQDKNLEPLAIEMQRMYDENGTPANVLGKRASAEDLIKMMEELENKKGEHK